MYAPITISAATVYISISFTPLHMSTSLVYLSYSYKSINTVLSCICLIRNFPLRNNPCKKYNTDVRPRVKLILKYVMSLDNKILRSFSVFNIYIFCGKVPAHLLSKRRPTFMPTRRQIIWTVMLIPGVYFIFENPFLQHNFKPYSLLL